MNYRETKFGKVYHSEDALIALDQQLGELKNSGVVVFFLVDENTHENCLSRLLPELPSLGKYELLEVPAGEESKSAEMALQLWSAMAELGADRKSVLINVGGGMITDLGGFLASTYMRGIRYFNIPTSLLGMVDASIGGKTGVDVGNIKNLAGAFTFSDGVFLIPDFLETLDDRELRAGFAEMLKHGLISDSTHLAEIVECGYEGLASKPELIRRSMDIKMDVVEADPKESGLRKILNFGHTFGHALESYALENYPQDPLLHGEAVAFGMWVEAELSFQKGLLTKEDTRWIQAYIDAEFGKLELPEKEWDSVLSWLKYDKKNTAGSIRCSLLEKIGKATFDVEVSEAEFMQAFSTWQNAES